MPEALATASTRTPSSAPCRSSPNSRRSRKSCSSRRGAAEQVVAGVSARRDADPAPDDAATRSNAASTSRMSRQGDVCRGHVAQARKRRPADAHPALTRGAAQKTDDRFDFLGRHAAEQVGEVTDFLEPSARAADHGDTRLGQAHEPRPDVRRAGSDSCRLWNPLVRPPATAVPRSRWRNRELLRSSRGFVGDNASSALHGEDIIGKVDAILMTGNQPLSKYRQRRDQRAMACALRLVVPGASAGRAIGSPPSPGQVAARDPSNRARG